MSPALPREPVIRATLSSSNTIRLAVAAARASRDRPAPEGDAGAGVDAHPKTTSAKTPATVEDARMLSESAAG